MEQDIATQVVGLGGSSDFTLWSLFLRADFVVCNYFINLVRFSWALIFDKFKLFKSINKTTEDFEKNFESKMQKASIIIFRLIQMIQPLSFLKRRWQNY